MKIDRVHFYVKDAIKTKDWFVNNIGFRSVYSHNNGHTLTEAIARNSVLFLFSSPLNAFSPVADYLNFHPAGVVDVAFGVEDIDSILTKAETLGVEILQDDSSTRGLQGVEAMHSGVTSLQYPQSTNKQAKIAGWGGLHHTIIETKAQSNNIYLDDLKIVDIDHIVLNVATGQLSQAVNFYRTLFGFKIQQTFNIQTKRSGLYSQALIDSRGKIQFNINEPTSPDSQIQEFLDHNNGSGIQHLALRSHDLINAVAQMRHRHINFLNVPEAYYNQLQKTIKLSDSELSALQEQQILVDCDRTKPKALLMQVFTQPIFEEPTFFLEFIERRHNAQGFGQGNFQALFEAVEREQMNRI